MSWLTDALGTIAPVIGAWNPLLGAAAAGISKAGKEKSAKKRNQQLGDVVTELASGSGNAQIQGLAAAGLSGINASDLALQFLANQQYAMSEYAKRAKTAQTRVEEEYARIEEELERKRRSQELKMKELESMNLNLHATQELEKDMGRIDRWRRNVYY